jgi:hypothetical protein
VDAQAWQEPTADESTHNADCDVGDQPKACALYRLASEPTRNKANHQDDK